MHFHFIMKHHSPTSPTATVNPPEEDVNNTEKTSDSSNKSGRSLHSSRDHPLKKSGIATNDDGCPTKKNTWSPLRRTTRRVRGQQRPFGNSMVHNNNNEFSWMEALDLFWKMHPKDWMILLVSLIQRHVFWPLLDRIRHSQEDHEQDQTSQWSKGTITVHYAVLIFAPFVIGLMTLIVGSVSVSSSSSSSSSWGCFLQHAFYLSLFILYCPIAWIALKWIVYIYDDPAIHRGVAFAKGWLLLVVRRGTRALQSQDSAAFLMAVSTLKAAPVGVNYIRYAIRYRMHGLNNVWVEDIARRHVLFAQSSSLSSLQQRLQEKITASLHPSIHHLRKLSDSLSTSTKSRPNSPGTARSLEG
jgi:hypothetical protein